MDSRIPQAELGTAATDGWSRHAAAVDLSRSRRYVDAEGPAREAWASLQTATHPTPEATTAFADNLAGVLDALGAVKEAEQFHRRAVEAAEGLMAADGTRVPVVSALRGLAANLRMQQRFDEAERCLQRALALAEVYREVGTIETTVLWRDLGTVYREASRLAESEATYRRVRAAIDAELGEEHPEAATLYRELALLEQLRGRHEVGETHARRALAIRMAGSGPQYEVVGDGAALGALLVAQGRYEESEPLLRAALELFISAAGPEAAAVAWVAEQLGSLLAATGRLDGAMALYRTALRIKERMLGGAHPALTTTMHNLAVVCEAHGQGEEARALWARAMTLLNPSSSIEV